MATINTKNKPMARATATLVVQHAGGGDSAVIASAFESAIDNTDALFRAGSATTQQQAEVVEARCDVTYGPVRATDGDLRRHLERQTREIASHLGAQDSAVFDIRTELISPEQVAETIDRLTAKANDISVPLALRKRFANIVMRLQSGKDAGRVRRSS